MNETKICWADFSWNPVTGCLGPHGNGPCNYCYARKLAEGRLRGRCGYPADDPFKPTLHPCRFGEPEKIKKPSRIFVSSMGDLFGDWVPDGWIESVFLACAHTPRHKYFFLTKNPKRYVAALKDFGSATPDNWYFGTSVENQATADERIPLLLEVDGKRFVSIEPLLLPIHIYKYLLYRLGVSWVIVGAQTNPDIRPSSDWVNKILADAGDACTPVWCKDNLRRYWPELPQEREE